MQGLVLILCLLPAATAHRRHRDEPINNVKSECEALCKADKGMDADPTDCLTECAVYTDLNTHEGDDNYGKEDALEDVAADESYNEAGGEEMAAKHEEMTGNEVSSCAPSVDVDKEPEMKDLDSNGDDSVTKDEAEAYGRKACVPDEVVDQIFEEADANQDDKVEESEFKDAGEDTQMEEAIDEKLEGDKEGPEGPFTGDDENAVVDAPPFDDFDKNQDAQLDADEVKDVMEMEAEKRTESNTAHMPTGEDETKLVADADTDGDGNPAEEVIEKVDKDGDGKVSQTEYKEEGDGGSDMGEELSEAAGLKEDSTDPDDKNRVDAPAEKAKLLSTNFRTAQRSEAAFLSKFKVVKPRQIFVGLQAGKRGFAKALHAAVRRHHAAHHHGHKRHHALRHPVMLNKRPHHIQ